MQLVPAEFREATVPCRHIPLDEQHDTIQSLYRSATPEEIEMAVSEWLMNMIQTLEMEQTQVQADLGGLAHKEPAEETSGIRRQCS